MMRKILKSFILFIFLALIGCGDNFLYSSSDKTKIKQDVYLVPEYFTGSLLSNYSSARVQTIELGQTIKFWAAISIDNEIIDNEHIADYPINTYWAIKNEAYNIPYFVKTFNETGSYDAILTTTDLFQDTLRDTITVQVNTPIKITPLLPIDGYNLLDTEDSAGITLSWEISGQDPWEEVTCIFYASRSESIIWNSLVDTVKCNEPLTILGPIKNPFFSFKDTSIVFYWGLKIITDSGLFSSQRDSTKISSFRTRLKDTLSIIEVPIKYLQIGKNITPHTRVDLISASGEVLASQETDLPQTSLYFKGIASQNNLTIKAVNLSLPEYKAQSYSINLISGTYTTAPSIEFIDSIIPERAPLYTSFSLNDSIVFKLKDQGSGINSKLINVILNSDTLDYVFSDTLLTFEKPPLYQCTHPCTLKIEALDNALNSTSLIHWTITSDDETMLLEGPFPLKELQ